MYVAALNCDVRIACARNDVVWLVVLKSKGSDCFATSFLLAFSRRYWLPHTSVAASLVACDVLTRSMGLDVMLSRLVTS